MSDDLTNTDGEITDTQDQVLLESEEVSSDVDVSQFTDEEYIPLEILSNDSQDESILPAGDEEEGQYAISRKCGTTCQISITGYDDTPPVPPARNPHARYMESLTMQREPGQWSSPSAASGRRILHARRRIGTPQFDTPSPDDSPESSCSDDGINRTFLLPQLIAEEEARSQPGPQDPLVVGFAKELITALLEVKK